MSGNLDISTPADRTASQLLPRLQRGRHVVLRDAGHVGDLWRRQPTAIRRLLLGFYTREESDESACQQVPMPTRPPLRLPVLARSLAGAGAAAFTGAAVATWAATTRRPRPHQR